MTLAPLAILTLVASAQSIVVITDGDSRPYRDILSGLSSGGRSVERLGTDSIETAKRLLAPQDGELWIALGPRATGLLSNASPRKRAMGLVTRDELPSGVSAVVMDVDAARQLAWIELAFPGRTKIVAPRSSTRPERDIHGFVAPAAPSRLAVATIEIRSAAETVPLLERALARDHHHAIVWLRPDRVAITADTVEPLVRMCLEARVPVVGFSRYFRGLGALAHVDIDYRAVADQLIRAASSETLVVEEPGAARLVVDGRLAERLGVAIGRGAGVELEP